jgi:ADP-heptose:LPS heptosyltransferase
MKILVMSLLRIGDIVLATPVLAGLRRKFPDAEIHLLINSQFRQISPLVSGVDRTIYFERDLMQKGLGEAGVPLFEPYERLEELVDGMEAESYDWAINLTHSRLSGWLMGLVPTKKKTGLCFDHSGRASFGSSWFRFLNHQVESEGRETFHFTDIFRFGLELGDAVSSGPVLEETARGKSEAESWMSTNAQGSGAQGSGPLVAVQVLTSDPKKDWSLQKFASAIESFCRLNPSAVIGILGAPFERERILPFVETLKSKGIKAEAAILGFEGAYSFLKRSRLLITGDTSIKHLAAAAKTPIVEISLGSSDVYRTGSYLHGSVIIQSREACAPCVHSKACHRATHACSDRIPADVVAMVANEALGKRTHQLKTIAEEFKSEVEILRVESRTPGFWSAYSVLEPFSEESVARWLDLACRKIWLGSANRGTEIRRLSEFLRKIHPTTSAIEWRHLLADFERQGQLVDGKINGFKVGIEYLKGTYEDPRRLGVFVRTLIQFRERIRHSALLKSFKSSMDQIIEDDISPPFVRFRRIVDAIGEMEKRTQIHLSLIRGLAAEMEEGSHEAQP